MQVVILAAGQGQRLRPLTYDRPKSMLSVAGRPLIHHLLESLAALDLKDILIVVGHGHERLQSYVGDGQALGLRIRYIMQTLQLGPGHALAQARDHVTSDDVLVLPADSWYDPRLLRMLRDSPVPAMVAVPDASSVRHGIPTVKAGKVIDLVEAHGPTEGRPSGGAYRVARRFLDTLEAAAYNLRDAIRRDLARNGPWNLVVAPAGHYADIVGPANLLDLHERLMADLQPDVRGTIEPGAHVQGPIVLGEGSIVRSGSILQGPVFIGRNCEVGPLVVLQPGTCLRNHVRVEPFTVLANCIVASNVTISSHTRISNAIVDNGVVVGCGVRLLGPPVVLIGSDAIVGHGALVQPGGRVGRRANIAPGRAVQDVPENGVAV